jgi:Domain of unknown function (DUF4159)
MGPRSELTLGVIRTAGGSDHRAAAPARLLWETAKRTSITTAASPRAVALDGDDAAARELFYQPLLLWTGIDASPLSDTARARLTKHLRTGGLLWIDGESTSAAFWSSIDSELKVLFPASPLRPLGEDHVIWKTFFLVKQAKGREAADSRVYGIEVNGRLLAIVTKTDVLGAYERDRFGTWRYECAPGGEAQREQAFRIGVNILMYATCLDYKADQVHIPFIMKKQRR